jgi:hypothetical protein
MRPYEGAQGALGTRAAYGRAWRPFAVWRVARGAPRHAGLPGRITMALTQRPWGIFLPT